MTEQFTNNKYLKTLNQVNLNCDIKIANKLHLSNNNDVYSDGGGDSDGGIVTAAAATATASAKVTTTTTAPTAPAATPAAAANNAVSVALIYVVNSSFLKNKLYIINLNK